jgi:trans-aconitate methyltransferase
LEKTVDQFDANTFWQFFSCFDDYNQKLINILRSMLDFTPESILDLACGVGLSTTALKGCFKHAEIVGIDIDSTLVDLAQQTNSDPTVQFQCTEITDFLAQIPPQTLDLIFVKSAYHYFEDKITLPQLQVFLKKGGAIVITERTARSAKSYPLPEMASHYWESIFTEPRPSLRLGMEQSLSMPLSVSCYGKKVVVPTQIYLNAVSRTQLVGLWMLKPEVITNWVEKASIQAVNGFPVFEEFWLYVYQNC